MQAVNVRCRCIGHGKSAPNIATEVVAVQRKCTFILDVSHTDSKYIVDDRIQHTIYEICSGLYVDNNQSLKKNRNLVFIHLPDPDHSRSDGSAFHCLVSIGHHRNPISIISTRLVIIIAYSNTIPKILHRVTNMETNDQHGNKRTS